MTTAAKTKNSEDMADAVAEVAGRITEEAKVATDTWVDVTGRVAEETKAILDTQQKMIQDGFASWQEYNQASLEFFTQASQQTFEESLAVCERWRKMAGNNWRKAQKLWLTEQDATVKSSEAFWIETQAASERMINLFTSVFKQGCSNPKPLINRQGAQVMD